VRVFLELGADGAPLARHLGFYAYRAVAWRAFPWLTWVLWLPPVPTVGSIVYKHIAKNRYLLPGGTATCALPKR